MITCVLYVLMFFQMLCICNVHKRVQERRGSATDGVVQVQVVVVQVLIEIEILTSSKVQRRTNNKVSIQASKEARGFQFSFASAVVYCSTVRAYKPTHIILTAHSIF